MRDLAAAIPLKPAVTFREILERCEEIGDCLCWKGSMNHGRNPQLWDGTRMVPLRKRIFEEIKDTKVPAGLFPVPKCGELRCLNIAHTVLYTYKQVGKRASDEGKFANPLRIAAITAGMRNSSRAKLSIEKAREIRSSEENNRDCARRMGVDERLVSRVRRGLAWREYPRGSSVFNL